MSGPFIGASISLISKADVRYVGTLFNIDPGKATVALQNGQWWCVVCGAVRGVRCVVVLWPYEPAFASVSSFFCLLQWLGGCAP